MKRKILSIALIIFSSVCLSQTDTNGERLLCVEKNSLYQQSSSTVVLKFKPNKLLKIKTLDGRKITSNQYFLLDSSTIVLKHYASAFNKVDTLSLAQVASIKGRVYGNVERKIFGGIVAASSIPLGIITVFVSTFGATTVKGTPPAELIALPFVGMFAAGISMTGARKFDTTAKWELKTIQVR